METVSFVSPRPVFPRVKDPQGSLSFAKITLSLGNNHWVFCYTSPLKNRKKRTGKKSFDWRRLAHKFAGVSRNTNWSRANLNEGKGWCRGWLVPSRLHVAHGSARGGRAEDEDDWGRVRYPKKAGELVVRRSRVGSLLSWMKTDLNVRNWSERPCFSSEIFAQSPPKLSKWWKHVTHNKKFTGRSKVVTLLKLYALSKLNEARVYLFAWLPSSYRLDSSESIQLTEV